MGYKWKDVRRQPAREPGAPPEVTPNAETVAAMRDARAGKVESFESVEALLGDLRQEPQTRNHRETVREKPLDAEKIAEMADQGKDVSVHFTNRFFRT